MSNSMPFFFFTHFIHSIISHTRHLDSLTVKDTIELSRFDTSEVLQHAFVNSYFNRPIVLFWNLINKMALKY